MAKEYKMAKLNEMDKLLIEEQIKKYEKLAKKCRQKELKAYFDGQLALEYIEMYKSMLKRMEAAK